MKRIGNVWKDIVAEQNGIRSVIEGTEQKRGNRCVESLLYDDKAVAENPSLWHIIDAEKASKYVKPIISELEAGSWAHKKPRHKRRFCRNRASSKGKWRDLYIPCLEDHIVHHMVMNATMQAFTKGMHPHCCGSVPGRGIKHILKMCKRWFQKDLKCRYFVKLDIRHFFDSIDKEKLMEVLHHKIKDKGALWVHEQIVASAPVACPVGYYTSPWYANLYLEKLDWYIEQELYKLRRGKRIKYVRHYLRYADDILLIGTSKSDLKKAVIAIKKYLGGLGLEIKPEWEIKAIGKHTLSDGEWKIKPGTYWCDIGGYKFCKDAVIMRDGIFLSTRRLARTMHRQGYYKTKQCQSLQAKLGWAKHSDSMHFMENEIKPYIDLNGIKRRISDVDKKSKRGEYKAARKGGDGNPRDRQEGL